MKKNILNSIIIFIKGFLMGMADIIPGVSGGTIALITGIYDKLIYSISEINFTFIFDFIKKDYKSSLKNFKRINLLFFIPLALGIGIAMILMSGLIENLLDTKTALIYSFFFGLILASAFFVFKKIRNFHASTIISSIIGLIFAFSIIGLGVMDMLGNSLPVLFFSGAIAICAMILPGISGSFILLLLGQYKEVLNMIHNLDIVKIITFGLGALTGILSFSKLLNFLLKRYHCQTMGFLTGLMIGSLRLPYIRITENMISINYVIISALIGFILVFVLETIFQKKKN